MTARHRRSDRPIATAAGSPFGAALAAWVRATPGARGAVLVDEEGDAVDYAHHPPLLSSLDLQLQGAQLALPLERTARCASAAAMGEVTVVLESDRGALLGAWLPPGFTLAACLSPGGNLGLALRAFAATRQALGPLLA